MSIVSIGIDLAKHVFAVHGVDESGKPTLVHRSVPRARLLELIASLPPCRIGMEAFLDVLEDIAKGAHFKLEQAAPVASVADLEHYDAIIVGAPTRSGRMPSQLAAFFDQAGGLWAREAFIKVGVAFTSTATQHGGQEVTLRSVGVACWPAVTRRAAKQHPFDLT